MQYSQFNIPVSDFPLKGNFLLYNSLHESFVLLHPEKVALISSILEGDPDLPASSTRDTLVNNGMLVEEGIDEISLTRDKFNMVRNLTSVRDFGIILTYNCNLKCSFCSQEVLSRDRKLMPDSEMAEEIISWISEGSEPYEQVDITFYGGEPMLHTDLILDYIAKLRERLPEKNLNFGITTNGTMLTPHNVQRLYEAGIDGYLIGMVGMEQTHDRMRPYRNGSGSWQTVLENLRNLPSHIKVDLNAHFCEENYEEIVSLIDFIKDSGFAKNIGTFSINPLVNIVENGSYVSTLSDANLDLFRNLRRISMNRGFKVRHNVRVGPCYAVSNRHSVRIDHEGNLYKCWSLVGEERFRCGDIFTTDPLEDTSQLDTFPWEQDEECKCCPQLPICGGGCRFAAFLKNGDYMSKCCEKKFFESVGNEEIRNRFLLRHTLDI